MAIVVADVGLWDASICKVIFFHLLQVFKIQGAFMWVMRWRNVRKPTHHNIFYFLLVLIVALVSQTWDSRWCDDTGCCKARKHGTAVVRLGFLEDLELTTVLAQGSILGFADSTSWSGVFEALVQLAHRLFVSAMKQILLVSLHSPHVLFVSLNFPQNVLLRSLLLHHMHSCLRPNVIWITLIANFGTSGDYRTHAYTNSFEIYMFTILHILVEFAPCMVFLRK